MSNKNKLKIAMFGAGRIGKVHTKNISENASLELAWICDPLIEGARSLAEQSGARTTTSADDVFNDGSVGAIIIGSPTNTHIDLISRAQSQGLAVLCEKPIDLDIEQVRQYQRQMPDNGAPFMLGFNRRFDPSYASIHARVSAGEIGKLEQLTITSRDPDPAPPGYIATSGGIFRDMTIHDLDLARFFIPEIVEVRAIGSNLFSDYIEEAGDYDTAAVVLRGADGEIATITNSRRCVFGFDQRLEAFGSEGMLAASNVTPTTVRSYKKGLTAAAEPYLPFFLERYADSYKVELDSFVHSIQTGAPCKPDFQDGVEALVLANAALESAKTGKSVTLAEKVGSTAH
jgi:myo-inositol 2-dehydrogenase/D-chiro-inositol 1-dehydrogenase